MKYKELLDGRKIPVIGLGTWKFGGEREADYSKDKETIEIIKKAIELGYEHIDTAELYGDKHCEEIIGEAIKGIKREKLFIASKVYKTNLGYDDLINACEGSLKRLGIEYLDLYLIHSPSKDIPLEESMKALDYLVEQGKIKGIGVSNFNLETLKKAESLSNNPILVNQLEYNLKMRNQEGLGNSVNTETEVIPYCQEKGIIVTAFKPLSRGELFGNEIVLELAKKYSKTEAQILLNWLVSKENVVAISMSENEMHLKENLDSVDFEMSLEDINILDELK